MAAIKVINGSEILNITNEDWWFSYQDPFNVFWTCSLNPFAHLFIYLTKD